MPGRLSDQPSGGGQQFGTAENISVSANGDYIAYDSEATNLVPGENDINYTPNVYVYDLLTNSVSVLLSNKQKFAKGGRITVIATPPGGVSSAAGVALDGNDEGVAGDNGVFTILANAGNHAWIGSVKPLTPSNHCTTDAEGMRGR